MNSTLGELLFSTRATSIGPAVAADASAIIPTTASVASRAWHRALAESLSCFGGESKEPTGIALHDRSSTLRLG
jgi:hypothetical protein